MPIYEYKCENCDKVLEVIQKYLIKSLLNVSVVKMEGAPHGINSGRLKGSGWHGTDFKTEINTKKTET